MNKKYFLVILLIALCASYLGLHYSYPKKFSPKDNPKQFDLISADGWIQDGSSIKLDGLYGRGNRLDLYFSSWHPESAPVPELEVFLCGQSLDRFYANKSEVKTLYLKGNCEPKQLVFKVLNPFQVSQTDSRKLGVQIDQVKLNSKFPLLVFNLSSFSKIFLAVLALLILSYLATANIYFTGLIGIYACYLTSQAVYPNYDNPYNLWLFICCLLFGIVLYFKFGSTRTITNEQRTQYQISSDLKTCLLILIPVLIGFLIRLYGLDFGLPARYHPDEVPKYNAITRMLSYGDLNPRYFLHPSLLLYSTYFSNTILQLFFFDTPWEDTLILAGRLVSAIAGTLSVYLVYKISVRLFARSTGLIAALFLAVLPLHVTCSRYVKEDILLTMFMLLTILAVIKAVQDDKHFWYYAAGFFAGMAASVKYTGALSFCILLTGPFIANIGKGRHFTLLPDSKYFTWVLMAVLIMPIAFVICSPYTILDLPTFLRDFMYEKSHMERGHAVMITSWGRLWMYHFENSLIPGMSLFTTLVSVIGVGFLIIRRRTEDFFLLAMILLFYLPAEYVNAKPAPQPERYVVPCLPFLAIFCAELIRMLERKGARLIAVVLCLGCLFFPAKRSVLLASEIYDDTRNQMRDYLIATLPAGSKIAVDWKPYGPNTDGTSFVPVYLDRARLIPSLSINSLKSLDADYLVLSSLFYDRYFVKEAPAITREQIRNVFRRVPIIKHYQSKQGTYGFHNPTLTLFSLKDQDFEKLDQEILAKLSGKIDKNSNQLIFELNK